MGIEPTMEVLQTSALPLGDVAVDSETAQFTVPDSLNVSTDVPTGD